MRPSNGLLRFLRSAVDASAPSKQACYPKSSSSIFHRNIQHHELQKRNLRLSRPIRQDRPQPRQPVEEPDFVSLVDTPPQIIRLGHEQRKRTPFVYLLITIPITAFALGCWQVQRLNWKTDLISKYEDRLLMAPLPLPAGFRPQDADAYDYRRVYVTGQWRHDQEMLVGPRVHGGENGFNVITPFEREDGKGTILISRGWIAKAKKAQMSRARDSQAMPQGTVTVEGLLREPYKKNMFTPPNNPAKGEWYFPDIEEMAAVSGSSAVFVEQTMIPDLLASFDYIKRGVPIGRIPEVNLRNMHVQYIFTWYALSLATTVMLAMVLRKPVRSSEAKVRRNIEW